ncbi:efflux RND transporter permease subunit [Jannaschia pohangensis]|uniref:Multidrug efflux pump n=1 Tax=Jannaschia pohangensis TaxID=390807 RepID=A0A1I3IA36_9RHOB|nr:efflux RND transporter permease subunit [Jannaschia pohangensis]SFI44759.1 multidrug efflux pump [Jannaschia pohangensis]
MTGLIDWAADRARMVLAFVVLSIIAGTAAYISLPKEGEPDIDIPGIFVSVPFPGISATDSEKLLVKPMETRLKELDGLKSMSATAAEGYAGLFLEFEFGWNKSATIADVRDKMSQAEADFPAGAEQYSINEINFSEFPILIVSLSGTAPERTLLRLANSLQDRLEAMPPILEAGLAGHRDEMLEVLIDPLALEAYNVTAGELISVVTQNNLLVATGSIETETGAFPVKIPGSFDEPRDVYELPVKTDGDRVITLGDLAQINLTFEDRMGTARYNGDTTVALQVVKRKGFNIIETAQQVRDEIDRETASWPEELRQAVDVTVTLDQSRTVRSMVSQLEGSVLTAIALVMIVVLATLGTRSALLVGFAIPTSFLLSFAIMAVMGITISNIVMFGLILAVGMLVDGAIVVVEYADKRISEGTGPMKAYTEAAKRMFWPVVSSTATTLCAFLPMLFWPGVPGEFMGNLPVTLIFVLSASLVVALVYLPVLGGVAGRISRLFEGGSTWLRARLPWVVRLVLTLASAWLMIVSILQTLNPLYLLPEGAPLAGLIGPLGFVASAALLSTTLGSVTFSRKVRRVKSGYRRSTFGHFINLIVGTPLGPIVAIFLVGFSVVSTFVIFGENNNGVEFFVESELEQANVFVRARGNLSLAEKDELLARAEQIVLATPGIQSAFAFAGEGGLSSGGPGASSGPLDTIGQIQIEMVPWEDRPTVSEPWFTFFGLTVNASVVDPAFDGDTIGETLLARLRELPGVKVDLSSQDRGPAQGKPIHLRLTGENWDELQAATADMVDFFQATPALIDIEDTLPLPGIDWEIDVDVEKAGRFGADVATVGATVQLVTRGILLDTMRVDSSDDEIEIRVRLPEEDRVLSTLDTLKVRTADGLVPLANFITRQPVPQLAEINRYDAERYFDVKADAREGLVNLGFPVMSTDAEGNPVEHISSLAVARQLDPSVDDITQAELVHRFPRPALFEMLLGPNIGYFTDVSWNDQVTFSDVMTQQTGLVPDLRANPINANERIGVLTEQLEAGGLLPDSVSWEWTGDQEEQAESGAFLMKAFAGALGLMFIILLAQFNSVYNSVLVLLAVVLSTTGVLIGMLVMDQAFSIIMTGTGIVALAGIVVNNNIVLIDTYQDYSRYMPKIEAITRTAEDRIRPVLLTTLTTMAGLAPMMFGLSLDFIGGGYSIGSPTALWWIQLATAVVWGLGVATILTLIFTPAMLAARVWVATYARALGRLFGRIGMGRSSVYAHDWALRRQARRMPTPLLLWSEEEPEEPELPFTPDAPARQTAEQPIVHAATDAADNAATVNADPKGEPDAKPADDDAKPDDDAASTSPLRAAE